MIARTWYGDVPVAKADEYYEYLMRTGVPDLEDTPGNRGVYVLRRIDDAAAHFLMISLWESIESIGDFAGDPVDKARYYPEDRDFLLELAPKVTHYEVLVRPEGT
jgi:heme-degrading monooxygenase HmoA